MSIVQMPDVLANKIAAGEVVERPASVVKELVENSIDAHSTWIKIDILEAGLQQVKITDNGDGMSAEDCERAFLRHATSKIKDENDLFHVRTLGFRGEALASIASVSKLTIQTSQGEEAGTLLQLEGGKVTDKGKSDARKGTEILVEDLFYNTPARLKYMKTIHTELGHITDLLNRLSLSHPEIRFEATHNGKSLFKSPGTGDLLQVISNVYGMGIAKQMLPIEQESLDFSIKGYIAKPEVTRASRSYISTVINGRYIRSIPLSQSILKAYHTLLPIGRYPVVVLSITMDPILVDVNVHPTKLEVRFSKEKELFHLIEEAIREKFRQQTLIPELNTKSSVPKEKTIQHTMDFEQKQAETISEQTWNQEGSIREKRPDEEGTTAEVLRTSYNSDGTEHDASGEEASVSTISAKTVRNSIDTEEDKQQVKPRVPMMYPIGQLHGTYIMAQNENGLYMVDQHAAQERIKYEFFKAKLGSTTNESQELLLPLTFDFSKQEAIFVEQYKTELEKVGLFFEPFGQHSFVIRSHPNWFPTGFEEEVIREMIEQIMADERINIESIREEAAIMMSCKRSIKANHHLNQEDMFRLLEDLRQTTDPFTCPHGRPIIVHFSSYELEKMFKRVM
ncbi:DNA mismatch repair endonuclease MutL [Oceanobacillus kapialis]|uniref:DNA mismatch repair protein MutL n=1 Tax=Oceanobacillus kapialis TaxID=481353 RepID=A0ABW5PZ03_9BACI